MKSILLLSPLLLFSCAHADIDTALDNLLHCRHRAQDSIALPGIIDVLEDALSEMQILRSELESITHQSNDAAHAVVQLSTEINDISKRVHTLIGGDTTRIKITTNILKPHTVTLVEKAISRIEKALSTAHRSGSVNFAKIVEALELAIAEMTHVRDELRNLSATSLNAMVTINNTALAITALTQKVSILIGNEQQETGTNIPASAREKVSE